MVLVKMLTLCCKICVVMRPVHCCRRPLHDSHRNSRSLCSTLQYMTCIPTASAGNFFIMIPTAAAGNHDTAKNKSNVSSTKEMIQGKQNQNIWSRGQGNGATQAGFHRAFSYGYQKPSFATELNYWRPSERSLMDSRGAPSSVL